jgi:hypothetical protein
MAFDAVRKFNDLKQAHVRSRGASVTASKKGIPKSTWGDVQLVGTNFLEIVDGPQTFQLFETDLGFVRTESYKRARDDWKATFPVNRYSQGAWFANVLNEYPDNEEFWTKGMRFAIARGGAGMVKTDWSNLTESIAEEAENLGIPKPPGLTDITDLLKIALVALGAYTAYRIIGD